MKASGKQAEADTEKRRFARLAGRCFREEDMRIRESRATINASLTMLATVGSRAELVRYIADRLFLRGLHVTDDMVHITHLGYNKQTDWDEYGITVDGFGPFGFADGPCPDGLMEIFPPQGWPQEQIFAAEIEPAFDVPCAPTSVRRLAGLRGRRAEE
jgi:hypothetical protein